MMTSVPVILAAAILAGTGTMLNAQTLYKSVGPDGSVVYSDRPPSSGTIEKTLDIRTLPNTAIPPDTLKELERLRGEGKVVALPAAGVVLFSASWCGYCRQAKAHLAQRGVAYREFDIDTRDGRVAFAQVGGGGGIPLLIRNGEKLRGYSRAGYEAILARR
jgi:glutaredoxin